MRALFFVILCIISFGCGKSEAPSSTPIVLTSIPPYIYFISRIAGETVRIETLVPPGANPHIFEPTPKQVEKARNARVWFTIGDLFEKKIATTLTQSSPSLKLISMAQGIPLLSIDEDAHELGACTHHHSDEGKDLHIWLSPRLARTQAKTIADGLIEAFPENRALYEKNLKGFLQDLQVLDEDIGEELAPLQGQAILVSHPAFGYFCHDYGLIQLSIECEGKDPLPRHITHILQMAEKYQVKSVLTQPQYNNKGAELIGEKLHLPIFLVDPYSSDYLNNLRYIAKVIGHGTNH